jgi:hypothetical protein
VRQALLGGVAFAVLFGAAQPAAAQVVYHKGTTRKMMQLTGDVDQPLRRPTKTLTAQSVNGGMISTDLGQPFMHKDQVWFTFEHPEYAYGSRKYGRHSFHQRQHAGR